MQQTNVDGLTDLNLLPVLVALLEERSVSKAARRLSRSQPAVSHALVRLRLQLQDELLVRAGQSWVLTRRAERLLPRMQKVLGDVSTALADRNDFVPAEHRGKVQFESADYGQLVVLPALLKSLRRQAPLLDIRCLNDVSLDKLESGESDMAMAPVLKEAERAGFRHKKLFDEHFVVVMRQKHPLAKRLGLVAYAEADHLFIAPRGTQGGVVDDMLGRQGLKRRVVLTVPQFLVAPHALANSDLICTMPSRLAHTFGSLLPLAIRKPPLGLPGFSMSMIWHERVDKEPRHRFLRKLVTEVASAV